MGRKNVRAKEHRRHHRRPDVQRTPTRLKGHVPKAESGKIVRPVGLCFGKLKFDTEANAAIALTQARAAHAGTGRIEKRHYLCPKCKGYHLTSLEKWVEREDPKP